MEIPYIDIHTHQIINRRGVISLCSELWGREQKCSRDGVRSSRGVHPWDASKITPEELRNFFTDCTEVAAIGECGFDFANGRGDIVNQKAIFLYQVNRAIDLSLPLVIHCVKASSEVTGVLRELHAERVVIHGFTGSPQQAQAYLDNGYTVSFGLTMLRSPKTQQALQAMPLDRLFLETDDSQVDIEKIYGYVSDIKKVDLKILKEKIAENYERVVGTL